MRDQLRAGRAYAKPAGWAVAGLAFGLLASGCSDLTPLSLRFVVNQPPAPALVTDGDYRLSGAVTLHLADQAGYCGTKSVGRTQLWLSALTTDDGARQALVVVTLPPPGSRAATGSLDASRATVVVQLDVNSTALAGGALDPTARSFVSRTVAVQLRSGSSGSVTAVLTEAKISGGGALAAYSFAPVANAAAVNLKGTFRCVAPGS